MAAGPDGDLVWVEAPAYGFGSVGAVPGSVSATESADGVVLENGVLRAELGRDGLVRSLVEVGSGREALAAPGNLLQVYDDHPTAFDAWDVDPFHLETVEDCPPATSCEAAATGPLRAEVVFERPVGRASSMRQVVRLDAGARRLEFHCEVDWRESHTMLKVLFPVCVRSPNATYQMQFGHAERPTHYSTSRDLARYEVPGHRFADLSEHGFGVALLTDCKYGYRLRERDADQPAACADRARPRRRHRPARVRIRRDAARRGWREAGVVGEAARFETPLRWAPGVAEPRSFFSVDDPNLVLDTVKRAEDSDALVVRLYEAHGARGTARLRVGVPFTEAVSCNLLEDPGEPLETDGDEIVLAYRPHEIVSVLVR